MSTAQTTGWPSCDDRPLDVNGRRRSPVACPGYKPTKPPATKGRTYPPDPFHVEDLAKLLAAIKPRRPGELDRMSAERLRALVVVLWRTGLRISEALALETRDLDDRQQTIIVRHGKGDKRRITMMDDWGWSQLQHWLILRERLPLGQIFCVLRGPTAGRAMYACDARRQLREAAQRAGLRRRANPHAFRHSHAVDLWREGIDVYTVQQQLGHARLDVTASYLRGVAPTEVLAPIGRRAAPVVPMRLAM